MPDSPGGERRPQSEKEYRLLFDLNPLPLWIYDAETLAFRAVNEAAVQHYGYSRDEFLTMTVHDIRPTEHVDEFKAYRAEGASRTPGQPEAAGVWRHRKKDGTVIDVEITRNRIVFQGRVAFLALAHDVTERRAVEEQLRRVHRLEAVGRLAGGVAHDFNNILTAVLGFSDLLLMRLPPTEALRKPVEEIKKAGERAATLTRQLLAFSRKQVLTPQVLDLNIVISGVSPALRRVLGEEIRLETKLAPGLSSLKADPGQIEQIILNLAVNAREAMPGGGTFSLETTELVLDEAYARSHVPTLPGRYVLLAARDSGTGMDEEVQAHLFEPFFTTKEKGKGTGMGLATVYGIVKQSGGYVWVSSERGKGTTFEIYLPPARESYPVTPSSPQAALNGLVKRILVVEDEDLVRSLVTTLLTEQGPEVTAARSGPEALGLLLHTDLAVDLLITDMVMPGMSGSELACEAARKRPGLKVLYMSGYADSGIVREGVLEPGLAFLQKPFTPESLRRRVLETLSGP